MLITILHPPKQVQSLNQANISVTERNFSCIDFIRAINLYSFSNEYHLIPFPGTESSIGALLSGLRQADDSPGRIQLAELFKLPEIFEKSDFGILHTLGTPDIFGVARMRFNFGGLAFPITTILNPLGLQNLLMHASFRLPFELRPYDALICTNKMFQKIVQELLDEMMFSLHSQHHLSDSIQPRVNYIPVGIDTDLFQSRDKADVRYQLHLPVNSKIILSFCTFSVYDNMDLMPIINAFASVVEQISDSVLVLAGKDPYGYAQQIKRFLSDNPLRYRIILWEDVAEIAKPLLYSAADIFVSPSDTLPLTCSTILEAMASGLPVIASDCCSYREILRHGQNGFKVSTFYEEHYSGVSKYFPIIPDYLKCMYTSQGVVVDVEEMAQYMMLLLQNDVLRQEMGSAAMKQVKEEYDWSIIIKQYENLWAELYSESQVNSKSARKSLPSFAFERFEKPFLGYGTSIYGTSINGQMTIKTTSLGKDALKTSFLSSYEEMKGLLYYPVIFEILNFAQKETTIRAVIDYLATLSDENRSTVEQEALYQILWLAKHGFLQINIGEKAEQAIAIGRT